MASSVMQRLSWLLVCGTTLLFGSACGSDSNSTGTAPAKTPATKIDGHASVLPSATTGGDTACPADFKLCSDGGCCPSGGTCSPGFICDVAPTACDSCSSTSSTNGRCCQGNCCPEGSTCNSNGLCSTKRVESTVPCGDNATTKCGDACCPAGAVCRGDVCEIHGGITPVCDGGGAPCDNGYCCPAGYSCTNDTSASYTCQKTPTAPAVTTTSATCTAGNSIVLPKGANCPAITPDNSYYMKAMCCPTGSRLYCQSPSTTYPQPTCLIAPKPYDSGVGCGTGQYQVYSSRISNYVCCPYVGAYPDVSDIDGDGNDDCYYSSTSTPTCTSGAYVEPTSGKCCSDTASSSSCCPNSGSTCGTGCCDSGDYCQTGTDASGGTTYHCAKSSYDSPTCPADAARRCNANDGSLVCCPLDTTCGPNGTCSCPLSANVDCGSFCATDSTACGCPSDHPDLCNGTCCLSGGCNRYGSTSTPDSCGCPSSATTCYGAGGTSELLCCPEGTECGTNHGYNGCLQCPTGQAICGTDCCAKGAICSNGVCKRLVSGTGTSSGVNEDTGDTL